MALTDPKYIIKNIVDTYVVANPITKDDGLTNSSVLHIYERGEESWKRLFFDEGYDVIFFYGEPRVRSIRPIQDVPVHFLMDYPVTIVTVHKRTAGGVLICTATTMQAKARTAIRAAIAASAQTAPGVTPAYTMRITEERGKNEWSAGINIWSTPYIIHYMTGGP